MTRLLALVFTVLVAVPLLGAAAHAQSGSNESDKSALTRFVESKLSSENRQIRLNGIEGALSSDAKIGEITVADRKGVWLRIVNAHMVWTRSALIFGRLKIDSLSADRIEVLRNQLPAEGAPAPSSSGFSLPKLPVAVTIDKLQVSKIDFGKTVFGLKSSVSLDGSLKLADGALDSKLSIKRLDGPGGTFQLAASYADKTTVLDLNLNAHEPKDGIIANLLGIEGRPAVDFSLAGKGPLDNLALNLTLDTAGKRTLTGKMTLKRNDAGRLASVDVHGPISTLISPTFRSFFGGNTVLEAKALVKDGGGFKLDDLSLHSGALKLDASAETTADKFLKTLKLDAAIANADGSGVLLPVPGQKTQVKSAKLNVDFGDTASDHWGGALLISRLGTSTFGADQLKLEFGGEASGIQDPKNRRVTYDVSGSLSGISTKNPDVKTALGDRILLDAKGGWSSGQPVKIASASIKANELALTLAGAIDKLVYNGTIGIKAGSLAPFAALADRPLAGSIDLKAKGTVKPVGGAFDLTFDGGAKNLKTGTKNVDALLAGTVSVSGRLARTSQGFEAHDFTVADRQLNFKANGAYAPEKADFDLSVMLSDLSLVTDRAAGRMTLNGTIEGNQKAMALRFDAAVPSGKLSGRDLANAKIGFDGKLLNIDPTKGRPYGNGISGDLSGSAELSGKAVSLKAGILATPDDKKLSGLTFTAGGTTLTGSLDRDAKGLIAGSLDLDADDISTAAALATIKAEGSAHARINLSRDGGVQKASAKGNLDGIKLPSASLGSADFAATVDDLFGVPKVEGHVKAADVHAGGVDVKTASVSASRKGRATDFDAKATLANGTDLAADGTLAEIDGGYAIGLDRFDLRQNSTAAHLLQPANVTVAGSSIRIGKPIRLDVAGGTVSVSGSAGDRFDLAVAIDKLPLSIANTVKPDLAAGGTISGSAKVTGERARPVVAFDLDARGITARPITKLGLPAFDVSARGHTEGRELAIDTRLTAGNGINLSAKGSVPLGEGKIDLAVDLARFPLKTIDGLSKGQNPSGTLTGTANVSGTLKAPAVQFRAKGSEISAAPLQKFGISPLGVDVTGSFRDKTVSVSSLRVTNAQGVSVTASGRAPLGGGALAIRAEGHAPLGLANRALAERGTRVDGAVRFNVDVGGQLSSPVIGGTVSVAGANVIDPQTNLRIHGMNVSLGIRNNRVTIDRFEAPLATGGSVTAGGTASIDPAAGFPVDLNISLNKIRYVDGDLLTVTASGKLTVTGAALNDPLVGGRIDIERLDIGIPDNLGGAATLTDIRHVHTPEDVQETLNRARIKAGGMPVPTARPNVARLNILINAPRRVFVRGRGLDAEMGGKLRVTGPISGVEPVGGFELIRGRLSILGKRIDFESGTITLTGTLDPMVNLTAQSQSGDVTVIITVSGRASDPKIDFTSQPALPQDEVLSQLIFGRSISNLSGFQIAQLAAAVAELAGGQNSSLLGNLRKATGLDDLDVTTDSSGNASVRAGRYIRDNVYLGVEAGAGGDSQVDINLDITKNLKAKAAAGTNDSSLGLFYEKDY